MFYISATHRFATFRNFFSCEALCRELCSNFAEGRELCSNFAEGRRGSSRVHGSSFERSREQFWAVTEVVLSGHRGNSMCNPLKFYMELIIRGWLDCTYCLFISAMDLTVLSSNLALDIPPWLEYYTALRSDHLRVLLIHEINHPFCISLPGNQYGRRCSSLKLI